ncbi:MAG TPA: Lrp/AsnC ligand binding domain-containing protein [Bdellovibrio sp.]|uniref:Lrp/AsnC ligand binding domain-containing protein n=1 Tax=Bdellovibrio sp. TaxID=28201 RepID=UPI002F20A813
MAANYQIDSLDQQILTHLLKDARKPFLEIARDLVVSGGTIHQRIQKMEEAGIIKGFTVMIDREKLGYSVTILIGIHLKNAKDCAHVLETLQKFPEVIETHYTTGSYALMAKVATKSIQDYYSFLTDKLQALKEIQSTESFICLASPMMREIEPS